MDTMTTTERSERMGRVRFEGYETGCGGPAVTMFILADQARNND